MTQSSSDVATNASVQRSFAGPCRRWSVIYERRRCKVPLEHQPLLVQQAAMITGPELAVQALTAAGDAIVTVDTNGRITSWNPGAEGLLGHRSDQAVGQTLALIIPAAHRSRHVAAFRAAMVSGALVHKGCPARVEAMTSDGIVIPIVMSLGLIVGRGDRPAGAVAVLRDATTQPVPFIEPGAHAGPTHDQGV
jgi:PAS domain S-box-containing protein